ncbi:M23 family metallopeptidase [Phenylobacterium sp.]|uniref:M23 family metallopeptidase n=1 Tax=Phenylobacterium sp. TaxID=1871053 RepID=UPI002F3EE371
MTRRTPALFLAVSLCACAPPQASGAARRAPAGAPALSFPLACSIGAGCEVQHYVDRDAGPGVRDYHGGRRTYEGHNGIDLRIADMAAERAGVNVLAAAPGRVARLRDGIPDVSIRAAAAPDVDGRECGNGVVIDHGGGWETQYCHLQQGSLRVRVGETVTAGEPIARVGLSGDTEFAHMHLSVRHDGQVVDPFAPAAGAGPLWDARAMKALTYKAGAVLNAGFASGPTSMQAVEDGGVPKPDANSPALVAYARAIELEGGDEVELILKGPDGAVLARDRKPLDRDKAQHLLFVGRKRPPTGWTPGTYRADYTVYRGGRAALAKSFEIRF